MIEIKHISKAFAGNLALDDVSFNIEPGRIHALVGENGSGKSTLIKILAGYYAPSSDASVTVDGRAMTMASVQASQKLGLRFVHQRSSLINEMSATDNIALAVGYVRHQSGRIDWKGSSRQASDLLASLDVELDTSRPVGLHREVDRSSIAIARAIGLPGSDVRCIALDEPTAALPPAEVNTLKALIRRVADSGVSILYVSHRLAEILDMATDLTVLRDGKHVFSGPTNGLTHDRLVELIVGPASAQAPQRDRSAMLGHGSSAKPGSGNQVSSSTGVIARAPYAYVVRGLSTKDLEDVDFTIHSGEVLGVCGLDGSGREDVVYALGGAVQSQVSVELPGGGVVNKITPRIAKRCGFALTLSNREPSSFVGQFSISEDLMLPSLAKSARGGMAVRRGLDARTVDAWIARLDIRPARAVTHMEKLSGGNQQRAIIAKWLNTKPLVMMYNDPTSGVDVGSRRSIYELIRAQVDEGTAVVVASSDLEDLTSVCDRVLVLVGGRLRFELRGDDISEPRLLHSMTDGLTSERVDTD